VNCNNASKLIQDYAEGRLFGLERKAFEEHIEVCPACSEELKVHEAMFALLGRLEPEPVPVWFEETVIRKLKLDGVIFEPIVPVFKKIAATFNRAPDSVKYPTAALLSAVAIYIPIRILLWLATGLAGKIAIFGSESYIAVDEALKNINVLSRFFEIVAKDIHIVKMVFGAFFSLLSSAGGIVLPVLGVIILFTLLFIRHFKSPQRRSHNAPYCF
jgi:hypothetical protein